MIVNHLFSFRKYLIKRSRMIFENNHLTYYRKYSMKRVKIVLDKARDLSSVENIKRDTRPTLGKVFLLTKIKNGIK